MKKKWMLFIVFGIFSITISAGTVFAAGSIKADKTSNQKQPDIEKRLKLLEFALISQSPGEVANTWAKGVMTRNGALQYAVLCNDLQSKYKSAFESWNWQTGVSSPWVDSYKISSEEQQNDGTWKFTIEFHYTDSTKSTFSRISDIIIGPKKIDDPPLPVYPGNEQKWCIKMINWHDYQSL